MGKTIRAGFLCYFLASAFVGSAFADSWPLYNSRDSAVAVDAAPANGGPSLQDILDGIYGCNGCVNANTNQQDSAIWTTSVAASSFPTVATTMQVSFSGGAIGDEFGIFSIFGSVPTFVPIFKSLAGGTSPGTSAILQWRPSGTLTITGLAADDNDPSPCGTSVNCKAGIAGITSSAFGFYVQNAAQQKFFTLDSLNPGGTAQALAYYHNSDWVLAFNDVLVQGGSSGAFNNVVVDIQSITALPEPRSIILLGTILVMVCGVCRRKFVRPGQNTN
jgi:hypothetical protein